MLGNRVPGLNRPKALPTEGLGMVSKSHLTVKSVAGGSAHHHSRGESQSLGSGHRRFTSQSSYSALTSPSLSAYDGEGGARLLEVDEFGGLNGLSTPQIPYSSYSPASTFSSPPSPEVSAIDKLPGKIIIPDKFQRRVVSDFQASYGLTGALTPDPEMPLQPLEEETPLFLADRDSRSQLEAESILDSRTDGDSKELGVQPPDEQTSELQISTPETHLSSPPADSSREAAMEFTLEPTSKPIPAMDVVEEGAEVRDDQRSSDIAPSPQNQDRNPVPEVSKTNPISIPLSSVMDGTDVSPLASAKMPAPSIPTSIADIPPVVAKTEQPASEPVEDAVPSVQPTRHPDDAPTPEKFPAPSTPALPPPPISAFPVDDTSSRLQTPPESPRPASSISTSTSDLSDSTIDYQGGSNYPDPDHDLFVLPLPRDIELSPRLILQEMAVPRPMHQVLASPLPTLQSPIDFPIATAGRVYTGSSDPDISFTGDESLALDASQAEIVIAQSEVIKPASPTLLVATPSPSPTTTTFRMQTPPLSEGPFPPPDEVDDAQVSPPRIRKKLYANHSAPTSFKDTSSSPPTQQSFSAVVHQKMRTSTHILPPDRVDSMPSKPVNGFMTPKKKQSLFTEPMTPASPVSELAFLVKNAAILEAQLQRGVGPSDNDDWNKSNPAQQSIPLFTEQSPRSTLRSEMTNVKSASTPALVSASATTPGHIPPVPDLVYDDRSSNSGLSSNPQIPSFLPQFRSRKSGAHEEDRRSLAPSYKSRKSEKSPKEKDKDSMPRARKLSSRLRSLANSSTNSLKSLGRPSMSSETSVSFESPTTVSIEPVTPQDTGNDGNGRLGVGMGSPGSRSQISNRSGSDWDSPPRRRDVLGRASSFADRLLSRTGKTKSGFLENSQGSTPTSQQPLTAADLLTYRFDFK